MLEGFYTTVAQASFTLLGLWWVLLQIRHDAWFADAAYRRTVYDVSMYFLLPAMMGLASLLATGQPSIWRVSFALLGAVGVLESVLSIAGQRSLHSRGALFTGADWLSLAIYALVVTVAVWEGLPALLGLRALELEGILVTALIFVGVTLAAAMFVTTGPHVPRRDDPPPR